MQVLLRLGAPTEHRGDLEPCSLVLCDLGKSPTLSVHYIHNMKMTIISPTSQDSCESESPSVVSDSLRPHGLYSPWNSPGQNTRVGSLSLLQGIFPTQG